MDVSKANILVSEASKFSAGARIFSGPQGPEILVRNNLVSSSKTILFSLACKQTLAISSLGMK